MKQEKYLAKPVASQFNKWIMKTDYEHRVFFSFVKHTHTTLVVILYKRIFLFFDTLFIKIKQKIIKKQKQNKNNEQQQKKNQKNIRYTSFAYI